MNSEITYPTLVTSLIGLSIFGFAVVGHRPVQSRPAENGSPIAAYVPQDTDRMALLPPASAPMVAQPKATQPATAANDGVATAYPYAGPVFSEFVRTSYDQAPDPDRPEFHAWMQRAYRESQVRFKGLEQVGDLDAVLAAIKAKYAAAPNNDSRTLLEKQTGAFCHKLIKKTIKHFSLNHGFEFYSVVDRGQRQCFLQSILIASMMQTAGMQAGVVMVTKSDKGKDSNNGHAVTLVKLSNGNDLLVDDSHKTPFIKQQGLMVAKPGAAPYCYLAPQYAADGDQIVGYAAMGADGVAFPTSAVAPLGVQFLKSQFDYYRGERTPGGFFAKAKTTAGLIDSQRFFTRSILEDPGNPLPIYALGRVDLRLGDIEAARQQILTAYQLYSRYGNVPQGEQEALALVHAEPEQLSMR